MWEDIGLKVLLYERSKNFSKRKEKIFTLSPRLFSAKRRRKLDNGV
jgi:hypothetical protein